MKMETPTRIDMLPTHISQSYASTNFLRISNREYKDFLLQLPLFATTPCFFLNKQFEQRDHFSEFVFRDQTYSICLRQNDSVLDDGTRAKLPLPNLLDNEIKHIVIQSLSLEFKAGGFYEIESERISQLLMIVRENSKKVGKEFTIDQIIKCLVKLEHTQIFIRRLRYETWYPVYWIVNLDFGAMDYAFYKSLNDLS